MGTPQALDIAVDFLSSNLIEGFRPHAYPDAIKGWDIATIGIGTTQYPSGEKVKRGDICTLDKAKWYLRDYLSHAAIKLQVIKSWDLLKDNEKAAVFSFAYNCGTHFYGDRNYGRMTRFLDDYPNRDVKNVFQIFLLYNSREVLTRRRAREACLFVGIPWDIDNAKLDATIKYFSPGV
jgi:lysozyme